MRKYLPYLFAAALAFLAPAVAITSAHAEKVWTGPVLSEEDPRFDCVTMGDRGCGMSDPGMVQRRAAEMSDEHTLCWSQVFTNWAGFQSLKVECKPRPSAAPPTTRKPQVKSAPKAAPPSSIKARPNVTG